MFLAQPRAVRALVSTFVSESRVFVSVAYVFIPFFFFENLVMEKIKSKNETKRMAYPTARCPLLFRAS